MHLYIMRHGETFWNKKGLIQGSSDIALTPYGEELARDTRDGFDREEIRFQRIYSSPYQRAVKTAEIIAEHQNISVKVDLRVREMCFGKYEGDKISEIRNSKDQNLIYCFSKPSMYVSDETGDNFSDVYARIEDFLKNSASNPSMSSSHRSSIGTGSIRGKCSGGVPRSRDPCLSDLYQTDAHG